MVLPLGPQANCIDMGWHDSEQMWKTSEFYLGHDFVLWEEDKCNYHSLRWLMNTIKDDHLSPGWSDPITPHMSCSDLGLQSQEQKWQNGDHLEESIQDDKAQYFRNISYRVELKGLHGLFGGKVGPGESAVFKYLIASQKEEARLYLYDPEVWIETGGWKLLGSITNKQLRDFQRESGCLGIYWSPPFPTMFKPGWMTIWWRNCKGNSNVNGVVR